MPQEYKKELELLEKAGIIVRGVSPWVSPIVVVPKNHNQMNNLAEEYPLIIQH